jgi:hypothetical protein
MRKKVEGNGESSTTALSGTPRHRVEQATVDAWKRDGLTTEEREELRRLRRENRVLRDERDILGRAVTPSRWRPDEPVSVRRGGESSSVSGDAALPDHPGLPHRPTTSGRTGSRRSACPAG